MLVIHSISTTAKPTGNCVTDPRRKKANISTAVVWQQICKCCQPNVSHASTINALPLFTVDVVNGIAFSVRPLKMLKFDILIHAFFEYIQRKLWHW
jgi:hypothetical protein